VVETPGEIIAIDDRKKKKKRNLNPEYVTGSGDGDGDDDKTHDDDIYRYEPRTYSNEELSEILNAGINNENDPDKDKIKIILSDGFYNDVDKLESSLLNEDDLILHEMNHSPTPYLLDTKGKKHTIDVSGKRIVVDDDTLAQIMSGQVGYSLKFDTDAGVYVVTLDENEENDIVHGDPKDEDIDPGLRVEYRF
jgi:hypothetical protein